MNGPFKLQVTMKNNIEAMLKFNDFIITDHRIIVTVHNIDDGLIIMFQKYALTSTPVYDLSIYITFLNYTHTNSCTATAQYK